MNRNRLTDKLIRGLHLFAMAALLVLLTFDLAQSHPGARTASIPSQLTDLSPIARLLNDVPAISATKTYTLTVDNDGDGKADPGDTIRYTITITNDGTVDATNVVFSDTIDANTTLVGSSIKVSPIAFDDGYDDVIGNTRKKVTDPASGLLGNDTDPDNASPTLGTDLLLKAGSVSKTGGTVTGDGTLSVNADGTFTYDPPVGETGSEVFEYTITDGDGLDSATPGTVTFTIRKMVWYVDNQNGGVNGCPGSTNGCDQSPFATLIEAQNASSAGDILFVFEGDGTASAQNAGITLKDNQQLIGEAVGLTVDPDDGGPLPPQNLVAAGNAPKIGNAGGDGVTASDASVTVKGLDISGSGHAVAVSTSTGSRTVTIEDNAISAAGNNGIQATTSGGTLDLEINDVSVTATGSGVNVDGSGGGTLNVTDFAGVSVDGATGGTGININTVTFDADPTDADFSGDTVAAGVIAIGSPGDPVGGSGMVLSNVSGDLSFTDLDIFAGGGAGLEVTGSGVFNAGAGTGFQITTSAGSALSATGGPALDLDPVTGNLTFDSVTSINSSGAGVFVDSMDASGGVGANALTITTLSVTNSTNAGLDIQNSTGTFTFGTTTINNSATADGGVEINNNSADTITVNFNTGLDIDTDTGIGLVVNGTGGTATNFNVVDAATETIDSTGEQALDIDDATLNATFDSVSATTGSSENGIQLDQSTTGTLNGILTINGGTLTNTAGAGTSAIDIGNGTTNGSGGSVTFTYAGTVNNTSTSNTSHSVSVQELAGGSVTISGDVSDSGGGIFVSEINNGTAASVTFSGAAKTLSTDDAPAVTLTDNANGTINFTNGGLDIDTTSGAGFTATGGGTITVQGTGNTIATTTGTALNVANTTIGASGLTFQSISAGTGSGSAGTGIILNNTGASGGLTVTGAGSTAGSGGTIQHKTGADGTDDGIGIRLDQTQDVSLSYMQLNDFTNFAISGTNVTNFTLADTTINGANGDSDDFDEGSVSFDDLLGSATFSNDTISGGYEDNILVTNYTGTLDRMTVTGGTIGLNSTTYGNDGILVESQNNAVFNLTVTGVTFLGARGELIQANALGTSTMDVVIRDNTFQNAHTNSLGGGITLSGGSATSDITFTYDVSGSSPNSQTFRDAESSAITVNIVNGAGTATGTIRNNKIGVSGVAGSGSSTGSGITIGSSVNVTHTVTIDNNDIDGISGSAGIYLNASNGSPVIYATITNNVINELGSGAYAGIHTMSGGSGSSDTALICADIRSNTLDASAASEGLDYHIDQLGSSSSSYNFPGYSGPATPGASPNALDTFLGAQNTISGSGGDSSTATNVTGTGSSCP